MTRKKRHVAHRREIRFFRAMFLTSVLSQTEGGDSIHRIFKRLHFTEPFRTVIQVNSFAAKIALVDANMGIGFVPSFIKTESYKNVLLKKIVPAYNPRKFYVLCNSYNYDQAVSDFFRRCQEHWQK